MASTTTKIGHVAAGSWGFLMLWKTCQEGHAEHGIKQQFLPCCIMVNFMANIPYCITAKFYDDVALLLPKGSFHAENFHPNWVT